MKRRKLMREHIQNTHVSSKNNKIMENKRFKLMIHCWGSYNYDVTPRILRDLPSAIRYSVNTRY